MRLSLYRLAALGGSLLVSVGAFASPPTTPATVPGGEATVSPAEREVQVLMEQLAKASETLLQKAEAADSWRYQIQHGEILLHLAGRSTNAGERNKWLEMAVDSYASAAGQCPANEAGGYQTLALLPGYIAKTFPASPVFAYATLKEIEADHNRVLAKDGMSRAREHHRDRLLQFADSYPQLPQAPEAILKAAQVCETMGKDADACRTYRKLADAYPGHALARKCREALGRLGGMDGAVVELNLPLLYPANENAKRFDLKSVRGKMVLVHFWSSASPDVAEGFQALKKLTDRGMEVIFVNLDGDAAKAKAFLSGQLTAGTHVFDPKGAKSPLMDLYGIEKLPETFQINGDGALMRHSLVPSKLEAAVEVYLPRNRR